MGRHEKIEGKDRVARRRAALRAQGLRPKQFWVHDTRRHGFWKDLNQQIQRMEATAQAADDGAWAESLVCWDYLPPFGRE